VPDAIGYKWNTTNDYSSATDMGTSIAKTETGLDCNEAYTRFVWAYSDCEHSLPVTLSQSTSSCWTCGEPVTDTRDYKVYNTVLIGTQCWFAQNLNAGIMIDSSLYQTDNGVVEKFCYRDLESNCDVYGGLYQWDEQMQYTPSSNSSPSGRQGVCPIGWHLPSLSESNQLQSFLGGWSIAGGKMKETGFSHWNQPNAGATNSSGFTGLGAGIQNATRGYSSLMTWSHFFTSTAYKKTDSYTFDIRSVDPISGFGHYYKHHAHSVRCLKDPCSSYTSVFVTISPSGNQVCAGTPVIFTATPIYGGSSPSYQWSVNGIHQGTDNPVFTYIPANNDHVVCLLTSNAPCQQGFPVPSNTIIMAVNPSQPVVVTIAPSANPVCAGTSVSFTAVPVNGGSQPGFQWKLNGGDIGTNSNSLTLTPINGDVVTCVLTSNDICPTGNPAISAPVTLTVNQVLPVGVTVGVSENPVCEGSSVSLTATYANGGSLPSFQWAVNGIITGSNISTYSLIPANDDIITCTLTSNYLCATSNPATAIPVVMTVNSNIPVSVSIVGPSSPVCSGDFATFTATPVNGGLDPRYQWTVNGTNTGNNNSIFTYMPVNGDIIECNLNSSETCTTGNPASSNSIAINVTPILPLGLSIVSSANPFCPGSQVSFTATPLNGGTTPGYQWKVNGANAGINNALFTYFPVAGDQVTCELSSNQNCVAPNPATSNPILMVESSTPLVNFTPCFSTITTLNAIPFKLKGGLPLGGIYSGPGVNSTTGIFNPIIAGTGLKTIVYTYYNYASCNDSKSATVLVKQDVPFVCGSVFTDPRDNHPYPTFPLPGGKCWMAANLNYGTLIQDNQPQSDNCSPEKYCLENMLSNCGIAGGFYQWDELMQYESGLGVQGLCPPGWHIPDSTEWRELIMQNSGNGMAGIDLKNLLTASGFHGVPYGLYYQNHTWWASDPLNMGSMFWTSTSVVNDLTRAVSRGIHHATPSVSRYNSLRSNALQVRCVRN
jgi:uncharacterized protein (TIGR02145 family)